MIIPFGKYRGEDIEDIPSDYLKFLLGQEWFEERFEDVYNALIEEDNYRSTLGLHWQE